MVYTKNGGYLVTTGCPVCGQSFTQYASRHQRFCSPACYHADHPLRAPLEERFRRYVTAGEPEECWLWTGAFHSNGYGQLSAGRNGAHPIRAHRLAYELAYGPVPKGLIVCHKCDVKACVNPLHLYAGTYSDNARDRIRARHTS